MLAMNLTVDDFERILLALLPRGRVWPKEPEGVQAATMRGLAGVYVRQTSRANNLLIDAFPAITNELLPEWELTLGLPDPCTGENPSMQQRRAQVVARLTSSGGQNAAFYIQFAAALGFTIEVTNYAPFRAGQSRAGQQLGDEDWFFTWSVDAPQNSVTYFAAGQSAAGDPLATWGNDVLECELENLKPAHTILQFRYLEEVTTEE
jgi:uncharacterized protein YmfQ (DUF2313 family)